MVYSERVNDALPDLPTVFAYLDHRAFLKDWFEAKKAANPRYSHRLFASKAGFSSPSMLHLVITAQRNITAQSLPRFAKALQLGPAERDYFKELVALDRARTLAERNDIYQRLRARQHFRGANDLEAAGFDYLSDWTLPAVRELAGAPGFRFDARWVAKRLRPRVTVARAQKALDTLVTLGMIRPSDDGGAVQHDVAVVTPHEVAGLAVYNYHRSMGGLALQALEGAAPAERHFGAVTVRVSADTLGRLKAEVAAFQERVLAICDEDEHGDRAMQLNLQLFPLSAALEEP